MLDWRSARTFQGFWHSIFLFAFVKCHALLILRRYANYVSYITCRDFLMLCWLCSLHWLQGFYIVLLIVFFILYAGFNYSAVFIMLWYSFFFLLLPENDLTFINCVYGFHFCRHFKALNWNLNICDPFATLQVIKHLQDSY